MKRLRLFTAALLTTVILPAHGSDDWQPCHRAEVKALKIFTVGEAALLRHNCNTEDLLSPPLQLSFQYFREVPGDAFSKAAMHFLEKNLGRTRFAELESDLAAFSQQFRDVDDGDRYTLTYSEGELILALNGAPLASQQGDAFARAYLSIWFGPTPYSPAMKESLLGRRQGASE